MEGAHGTSQNWLVTHGGMLVGTIVCTSCGRHTPARSSQYRHWEHDAYADRRAGRTALYVLLLPFIGFTVQLAVGGLVLLPFLFICALASGAGKSGRTDLLTGFVFGVSGIVISLAFTSIAPYRRFARVRELIHRVHRA